MPDRNASPVPLARTATRIVEALAQGNLLYIAGDEPEAEAIAAAAAAITHHAVVYVPSSDALPGDDSPASPANAGRRVVALRRLKIIADAQDQPPVACIVGAEGAARLYPPPGEFGMAPPRIAQGDAIDVEALFDRLIALGYFVDDRIDEPGEIAVRGEVIDLFPADGELPVRIEVTDGRIASLRSYDPITQRTVGDLDCVELGNAAEPAMGAGVPLLAHLRPGRVVIDPQAEPRRQRFLAIADEAARLGSRAAVAVAPADWEQALSDWEVLDWHAEADDAEPVPRFVERKVPWAAFRRAAGEALAGGARVIVAGAPRDLRFLRPRLTKDFRAEPTAIETWSEALALPAGSLAMLHMPVLAGFRRGDVMLVAAADLLGSRAAREDQAATSSVDMLGDMTDLRIGDIVVHEDHGIARVTGVEPMPGGESAGDAIVLEHADEARRLIPIADADRLWRYGADADAVTLDKLDGSSWLKRRGAIIAAVNETAGALAAMARVRAEIAAPAFAPDQASYERFAAGFGFTETADQARAIGAVRDDLASGRPMDRLVIGDVGYGKTEVGLRAAALVALAGGQVAIAAPTTVLVRQHLESFRRRFAGTGITVAGLSRLSSAAEKKVVKAGLADGSIGVVVGTGAVAGKDVAYKSLGLVVIDEEQRFGAADKGKLRGEGTIHVLTLSATPIPRTLQTALVGLQQLSIIATPPARRQPIRTTVDPFDDARVRIALLRESKRGGQSFVVAPRIEDLAGLAARLGKLAPELKVVQVHGKLPAADLDEAMVGFAEGKGDVLLATNIIEAGLDVPRANTMVVWRADRFGLAQLHQLRGRVGRGGRRGQVLLTTDGTSTIGERTLQRLRTLQAFDRLGAGFAISARDLDMRGAGDLVGDAQAGHIKLIGVALYQHLLENALRELRGETVERWTPELNLGVAGSLPADWIPEAEIRVALYARLARLTDSAGINAFEEELADRFGALPADAQALLATARLQTLARAADIARIDAGPAAIALTPRKSFSGDPATAGLTRKGDRLILAERIADDHERARRAGEVLEELVA